MAAHATWSGTLTAVQNPPGAPVPQAPVSPVRVLVGRYQQVLDRVEDGGSLLWARVGRRRFTRWIRVPAPRIAVLTLLTVHVRARVRVLERRGHARVALLKECAPARRDLETLTEFRASLRRTPGVKIVAPLGIVSVLLAAFVLANYVVRLPLGLQHFLGDLTKAALTVDRGQMVDAVTKNHMDAISLLGALTVMLWATALVTLPLVPAAGVVRQLVAEQPGLPQAEAAGFAALRARRPSELELGLLAEACLVASTFTSGLMAVLLVPLLPSETATGYAVLAGWCLGLAGLTFAGMRRHLHGLRPNRVLRIARRVLLFQFLLGAVVTVLALV